MPTIVVDPSKGLHQKAATSDLKAGTLSGHKKVVKQLSSATTLTAADSGKIFTLVGTAAYAITLPTATTQKEADALLGWSVIVINETPDADDSDDRTIIRGDASNDVLIGNIVDAAADGAAGLTLSANVITFVAAGGDAAGDMVEIICYSASTSACKFVARGICAV